MRPIHVTLLSSQSWHHLKYSTIVSAQVKQMPLERGASPWEKRSMVLLRKENDLSVGTARRTLGATKNPGSCCCGEILYILESTVEVHRSLNFPPSHWIIVLVQLAWGGKEPVHEVSGSPEGWSGVTLEQWTFSCSRSQEMLTQMKWQCAMYIQPVLKTRKESYRTYAHP